MVGPKIDIFGIFPTEMEPGRVQTKPSQTKPEGGPDKFVHRAARSVFLMPRTPVRFTHVVDNYFSPHIVMVRFAADHLTYLQTLPNAHAVWLGLVWFGLVWRQKLLVRRIEIAKISTSGFLRKQNNVVISVTLQQHNSCAKKNPGVEILGRSISISEILNYRLEPFGLVWFGLVGEKKLARIIGIANTSTLGFFAQQVYSVQCYCYNDMGLLCQNPNVEILATNIFLSGIFRLNLVQFGLVWFGLVCR